MRTAVSADLDFADFVQARTPSLLSTAYLLTRDRHRAEELVQDVLVSLYPQWQRVLEADSELAYVRRALVNRFINLRRKRSSSSEVFTGAVLDYAVGTDFASHLADRDQLRRALDLLPDRQRVALVLRYFHDLSDEQTADILQCRLGTVRSLVSRALATLRSDPAFAGPDVDSRQKGAAR
jgi:RNA polymerase sigma-70 factor (sigma-E family)